MNKKDIQILLSAYKEEYPNYLTTKSYLEEYTYWNYKPEADLNSQISSICYNMYFDSAGRLGIYQAFQTGDIALLNNALYQYACEKHLHITDDNCDQSSCCRHGGTLYYVMAANLWERIPLLMPKALGMTQIGMPVTANLFLALWYQEPAVIKQA